jgi:hypothetical protein
MYCYHDVDTVARLRDSKDVLGITDASLLENDHEISNDVHSNNRRSTAKRVSQHMLRAYELAMKSRKQ